jgi:hypothetical protein
MLFELYFTGERYSVGGRSPNTESSYETTHSWNSEPQNIEGWNRFAQSFFIKIDRIHYFDIRHSLFDIRFFRVSSMIRLGARGQRRRLYETSSGYGKIKVGPTPLARHTQGV